jgi:hypothetical protein
MGRSFRIAFSILQKKMAAVWAGHKIFKLDFSLSARVLRRKPTRQPAQKKAVILYAIK